MYRFLLALLLTFGMAGLAHAHGCPGKMADIDEAMEDDERMAELSPTESEEVRMLRFQGEEHHADGNHDDAMKALAEAKEILGLR